MEAMVTGPLSTISPTNNCSNRETSTVVKWPEITSMLITPLAAYTKRLPTHFDPSATSVTPSIDLEHGLTHFCASTYLILVHDISTTAFRYALDEDTSRLGLDELIRRLAHTQPQFIITTQSEGVILSVEECVQRNQTHYKRQRDVDQSEDVKSMVKSDTTSTQSSIRSGPTNVLPLAQRLRMS